MNAKERSVGRIGLILSSALALAATGCATHVHKRTVYVPPPVVLTPPPPEVVTPPPAPPPPPVVVAPPAQPPVVVVPPAAPAPVVVIQAERDFYEPLSPYGRWVVVPGYGYSWVPARVETDWRPYSDGYWQRTDAGWYWVSEEPWGWATYHYGRWDWHAQFGWFWVPQTQWAPAWVAWREGGGYVGWAPLRPSISIGASLTSVNYEPAFASRAFVFVEQRHMMDRVRPKNVVVNNTTIINKTVNITKVNVVNKTVINEGPRPDVIERESGRKIHTVAAREFRHREETAVAGRNLNMTRNNGPRSEPIVRKEVEPRPTPAPIPRREQPIESKPQVTRPSAPARPVTVSSPAPTPAKRDEVVRQEPRNTPARVPAPRQRAEAKSNVDHPAARPTLNPPAARPPVERPVVAIPKPAPPAPSTATRNDVSPRREQPEFQVRGLTQAAARVEAKPAVQRSTTSESKPQTPKVGRPTVASANMNSRPQESAHENSRPLNQPQSRSGERGNGSDRKERD
ncbi:MAG TPA: DUF6600 domain-containing protein [Verrucomicrobiae bacterium]|nr:DUF6600 domain-containing protein [Verrucomicrobiae bacterium]